MNTLTVATGIGEHGNNAAKLERYGDGETRLKYNQIIFSDRFAY